MHSLKILPFSPPPALPRHRCSPHQTVVSCRPRRPGLPFSLAVRRSLRTLRCLADIAVPAPCAVIVVLVLWLVRETFSDLLLG